jgi:predicted Fe-Mo cluster-binding NifX family protein
MFSNQKPQHQELNLLLTQQVEEVFMPYTIALASSGGEKIDLHFGHTDVFRIFEVDETSGAWRFIEERAVPPAAETARDNECPPSPPAETGGCGSGCGQRNERLAALGDLLSDCGYVLAARIGPKPQAFLKRAGITALEAPPELSAAIPKLNAYHLKYAKNIYNQEL